MTLDVLGYTHDTMAATEGGLQLDLMKPESLVIAGQLYCGEYVLESCTHCPSSQGSREYPKFLHFVRKRTKWRRQTQTVRRITQTQRKFSFFSDFLCLFSVIQRHFTNLFAKWRAYGKLGDRD